MATAYGFIGKIYIAAAFLVWCASCYYMFRIVALRKPGIRIWRDTSGNPFNLILMPSKLTKGGIEARRKLFICLIIFILMVLVPLLLPITAHSEEHQKHMFKPAAGYVPDEETAIKIAIAVWEPIYGKENIESEKPYKAILKDSVWYVTGSLPKGWVGGVAEAEINKVDGCIIRVSHGK